MSTKVINANAPLSASIPLLAYGFIGTEIVSVTAFEAKDRTSLRFPVRYVAYIITALYFASAIPEAVVVYYQDCNLPSLSNDHPGCTAQATSRRSVGNAGNNENGPGWVAVVVLAAWYYGSRAAGWFFNACIIYFCLSAANTALYVASRTLFGLTRGINRLARPPWYLKPFRYFGMTTPNVRVPHFALIFSAVAFFWLPFLRLRKGYSASDVSSNLRNIVAHY